MPDPRLTRRLALFALLGAVPLAAAPLATAEAQPGPYAPPGPPGWYADQRRRQAYERWRATEMRRREREARRRHRDWRRESWEEERERQAWAQRQRWYR